MIEGIGSWSNFEELEDSLILDELLLLHETIMKREQRAWKLQAMLAGADVDLDDDDDSLNTDGSELPPELLEREREWQAKKKAAIEEGEKSKADLMGLGIGYTKL